MSGAIATVESLDVLRGSTIHRGQLEGMDVCFMLLPLGRWCTHEQIPERTEAWGVFVSMAPPTFDHDWAEVGRVQWATWDHESGEILFWGTNRGGKAGETTSMHPTLAGCAERMVRRWLGLPAPGAA